jgi:N-acetylmuramic acid 6-phosphate etherase
MMERRHPETHHIDTLATLDMLTLLHKDDRQIADAVGGLFTGDCPSR